MNECARGHGPCEFALIAIVQRKRMARMPTGGSARHANQCATGVPTSCSRGDASGVEAPRGLAQADSSARACPPPPLHPSPLPPPRPRRSSDREWKLTRTPKPRSASIVTPALSQHGWCTTRSVTRCGLCSFSHSNVCCQGCKLGTKGQDRLFSRVRMASFVYLVQTHLIVDIYDLEL